MVSRNGSSSHLGGIIAASLFCISSLLTGCGLGNAGVSGSGATGATPAAHTGMSGSAHGGQQPITGATITIYVAGVNSTSGGNGYGTGAVSVASTTTDGAGNFNIPAGTYTCPAGNLPAYIVATGGNAGAGATTAVALMAALGTCPTGGNLYATYPVVNITEATTVAAVWALQQFMAAPAAGNAMAPQIGAPNTVYSNGLTGPNAVSVQTAVQGMNNAFLTANILVNVALGGGANPNYPNTKPETTKINTLADIIAYCVNSAPAGSNCNSFFAAATPTGAAYTATDTIQAAWYMAQNPIHNLPTLWGYITSTSLFQPYLGTPGGVSLAYFNDTTIAINYLPLGPNTVRGNAYSNNVALAQASNVAIDAYGNAWFINRAQDTAPGLVDGITCPGTSAACNSQSVSEIGVDGSPLVNQVATFTATTAAGKGANSLFSTVPAGGVLTTGGFPGDVAIDLANNAWVSMYNGLSTTAKVSGVLNTVGVLAKFPGSTVAGTGGTGGNATLTNGTGYFVGAQPFGLTIDGSNNIYMTLVAPTGASTPNFEAQTIARMSATDGSGYTASSATGANLLPAAGQAFIDIDTNTSTDTVGTLWVSNFAACVVTGNLYSGTTGTTGNLTTYGLISQYGASNLAALSDSEIAAPDSGATTGAGTSVPVATTPYGNSGNCGSTAANIGQVLSTAYTANPYGLAVDRNNGVIVTDQYNTSVKDGFDGLTYITAPAASTGLVPSATYQLNGQLPSSATATSPTVGIQGTTLGQPGRPAVDGNNNIWVGSLAIGSVTEASYNPSTQAFTFLTPGQGTSTPFGANASGKYGIGFYHYSSILADVAIDPSGNVWVANDSNNSANFTTQSGVTIGTGYSTTVIVGAAGPVITPKALAVKYNMIGQKP